MRACQFRVVLASLRAGVGPGRIDVVAITVLIADDNLIIREGLKALLEATCGFEVVGVAGDYDELVSRANELQPQVVVSDIRMPPRFMEEGLEACRLVRKRHPGTGVVILSQYDDPDYAISLLREGAAGCAYLLKDGLHEGEQLARAIKQVSCGGSVLDPRIAELLIRPAHDGELSPQEKELLYAIAEGKSIKAIAAEDRTTPAAVSNRVERLFLELARDASAGGKRALAQLRLLHEAIVQREEQGETLSRLLPTGIAERLRGQLLKEPSRLQVTVLMSDVRGYSVIAESSDPLRLCEQLKAYRAAASRAVLERHGTVMQFVGDAVMAVFGAPEPLGGHADLAFASAEAIHRAQEKLNAGWAAYRLPPFELGIGLSTGAVAAGLLGADDRMEYSVVGDVVNLAQRLQQLARGGSTVLSEATYLELGHRPIAETVGPTAVPGRTGLITAYRVSSPPGR